MRGKINDLPFLEVHELLYEEFHFSVRDRELSHLIVVDFPDFHSILVEVSHEDEIIPNTKPIKHIRSIDNSHRIRLSRVYILVGFD